LENYYVAAGEEPGRWVGAGADAMGLDGEVAGEQLEALFDHGLHPITGEALGRGFVHFPNRSTVTGFALSFSPPKSVSLLWGLTDETVSAQVREAHDAAVSTAVSFLEQHASFSRSGKGGVFQVDTAGFVAAAFVHRTSRARDPQLHTHVLVANKTEGVDGRWRSLDGRELYTMQKPAGMVYNAAVRAELTARLGVAWEPVDANGQADIAGVPTGLIERFSSRRRQVLDRGAARIAEREAALRRALSDGERAEEYQRAALERRPGKAARGETPDQLRERWGQEAETAGHPATVWLPDAITRSADRVVAPAADSAVVEEAVAALVDGHATFGRAEIAKALLPSAPATLGDADSVRRWVENTTEAVLAHPEVVTLACPLLAEVPEGLRRADGLGMVERHGQRRWTTRTTLEREAFVLDVAEAGRTAGVAVVTAETVEAAVTGAGLSGDQAAAVTRRCAGGEQVACLVGPAGTGKTHTLAAASRAWEAAGYTVTGVAVSARAAGVLAQETDVDTDTLTRTLGRYERGDLAFGPEDVLLVDEAGMVTTVDLARLAHLAANAGTKLVLTGDDHQLPPVGAGGLFRLLVDQTHAAELGVVRRFSQPWEPAATVRLRRSDPTVVDDYQAHGRIHGGSRQRMVTDALAAWKQATDQGESVIVLGVDRHTVDTLAAEARRQLVAAGDVEPGGVITGAGQVIGVGDQIVTCRNDRQLLTTTGHWVRNGDRWTVTFRSEDGSLVVESSEGHGRTVLDAGYVDQHVRLAYALTVHKAQGVTVDRSILVADDALTAEHAYVALSRGRHHNAAYLIAEADPEHGRPDPADPDLIAAQMLARAITRPATETSATLAVRVEQNRADDLAVLYPLLEQARSHITANAGPDRTSEIRQLRADAERRFELQLRAGLLQRLVDEARPDLDAADRRIAELRPILQARTEQHWWRRPSKQAYQDAKTEFDHLLARQNELRHQLGDLRHRQRRLDYQLDTTADVPHRLAEAEQAQAAREAWIAAHPADINWLHELHDRISDRTTELGQRALDDQPEHLIELLGQPGDDLTDERWAALAGRVEAYRERWRLSPHDLLTEHPTSPSQIAHWRSIEIALPEPPVVGLAAPAPSLDPPGLEL
jgi:conjugative relaxase-like TrwC/TraI family protein